MELLKPKSIIIGLSLLLIASIAYSQKPDFSGIWVLKDQKIIKGTLYSNGVPKQMKITQQKDKIDIEKVTTNQSREDITVIETFLFDGKSFETVTLSKRKKIITMKWNEDDRSFKTSILLYNPLDNSKVDFKITDTWITDSIETLIMTRKNENFTNGEVWESRSEYEKNNSNTN